ncbi:MAG: 3-phosphoserine/phosphohydroxythreonine transaminase [Spirochaetes bacterium]|nr:3-phosphoserine/phosphohydroxythreonine transaminase [Spirochaetota bacterium]
MDTKRPYNFYAGPAILPLEVLKKAQTELLNFSGTGISVMETSHRSKPFDAVITGAEKKIRQIMNIPDNYEVLFLQGGASLQFAMIPLNFLKKKKADYVHTGSWAKLAIKEAKLLGEVHIAGTSEDINFSALPKDLNFSDDAEYVHITSNETINGTQWHDFPDTGKVPLIADMSSDIMSRKIDINKFSLIYAGAQKNIGTSGVTLVIIRKDLIEKGDPNIPTMLKYSTHAEKKSLHNTPSVMGIYITDLVMDWVLKQGGLDAIEKTNDEKAKILYDHIDSTDFYQGLVEKEDRSSMNVVFRIKNNDLEPAFIEQAKEKGFIGLKGHRSLGGLRASIYNAFPVQGVKDLVKFMKDFEKNNS